jgi:hypothetical protein
MMDMMIAVKGDGWSSAELRLQGLKYAVYDVSLRECVQ